MSKIVTGFPANREPRNEVSLSFRPSPESRIPSPEPKEIETWHSQNRATHTKCCGAFQPSGRAPSAQPCPPAAESGATGPEALKHAIALEHIAAIATHQAALGELVELGPALRERHFQRKRGPAAYYGQDAPGRGQ